jgi:hypothetical protein
MARGCAPFMSHKTAIGIDTRIKQHVKLWQFLSMCYSPGFFYMRQEGYSVWNTSWQTFREFNAILSPKFYFPYTVLIEIYVYLYIAV